MSEMPITVSREVRDEVARAFRRLRPRMLENALADADLDPESRVHEFREEDLEQFLNAYEALFVEALEGRSRDTRDLVLDTALPPFLEIQTPLGLVRSNVLSAVMLAHRLIPLVREDLRDEAARWLASFLSGYTYELADRALALRAGAAVRSEST